MISKLKSKGCLGYHRRFDRSWARGQPVNELDVGMQSYIQPLNGGEMHLDLAASENGNSNPWESKSQTCVGMVTWLRKFQIRWLLRAAMFFFTKTSEIGDFRVVCGFNSRMGVWTFPEFSLEGMQRLPGPKHFLRIGWDLQWGLGGLVVRHIIVEWVVARFSTARSSAIMGDNEVGGPHWEARFGGVKISDDDLCNFIIIIILLIIITIIIIIMMMMSMMRLMFLMLLMSTFLVCWL